MWFKISTYISFLLKSTNQHGVHSPFVYNLVTKCFYSKTNRAKILLFKKIKKHLKNNTSEIEISDFGKGSRVFKSNTRKISDIAKIAGITTKKAFLLIRLVEYFNPKNVLEIGSSVGLGSCALHIGNANSNIYTLEGCKNTAEIAEKTFNQFQLKNIQLIVGNFQNTLPEIIEKTNFNFIYFDGNHQKEATLNYFNRCLQAADTNAIFIFDDIYWNKEMHETWEIIKQHPKVTVTINTYFWGIVFFRNEQLKQHFTIRV
ncbi:O-methyltransferase [Lutibacter sp.]|uniref:O-methyltransferase n=1 Tax=Lutibacter sp. TaxID=1925666 RepID=UPI001A1ABB1F|nr:class I SAM-dependent methyltransferase [Lutibacter sp.]MBI9041372.1 class I SAM-dependent methyltransferase [Lutibacter sp.]